MNSLIFRTVAPSIVAVMLMFSIFVLLRGHNEPGGGFIGGLIAAASILVHAIAAGAAETRRALRVDPVTIAGFGVLLAVLSGVLAFGFDLPFLTGLWAFFTIGHTEVALSTPLFFDIGVYATVFGAVTAIALALEDETAEGE